MRWLISIAVVVSLALGTSAMANNQSGFSMPGMAGATRNESTNTYRELDNLTVQRQQYKVATPHVQVHQPKPNNGIKHIRRTLRTVRHAKGTPLVSRETTVLANLSKALVPVKVAAKAKMVHGLIKLRQISRDVETDLVGSGTPLKDASIGELMFLELNGGWTDFVRRVEALNSAQVVNNQITPENVVINNGRLHLANWHHAHKAKPVVGFKHDIEGLEAVKKFLEWKLNSHEG